MKQRELNALVKKLQKLLKLEGWKIKARIVKTCDTEHAMADVTYESEWKTARIDSLSPEALAEHFQVPFRQNLIHEMLHLLFEGHKEADGPYDPPTEFAINTIAAIIDRSLEHGENNSQQGRSLQVEKRAVEVSNGSGVSLERSLELQRHRQRGSRAGTQHSPEVPKADVAGTV